MSSEPWFGFLSVCRAGDGISLRGYTCPAPGSFSGSILPCFREFFWFNFLSPCCSSESLGELSISQLVLLDPDPSSGLWVQEEEELRGSA